MPPGAGRTPPTVRRARENAGTQERRVRVGARRSSPRVLLSRSANPGGCNDGEIGEGRSWGCGLAPGAGRTPPWVWHWAWNAGLGVGARRSSPRVLFNGSKPTLRRRVHSALGLAPQRRTPVRGLAKDAVRPGSCSGGTGTLATATMGDQRGERSPATGYVVTDQPGGNCAAMVSVRYVAAGRPERVEAAGRLFLFSSYAAGM